MLCTIATGAKHTQSTLQHSAALKAKCTKLNPPLEQVRMEKQNKSFFLGKAPSADKQKAKYEVDDSGVMSDGPASL